MKKFSQIMEGHTSKYDLSNSKRLLEEAMERINMVREEFSKLEDADIDDLEEDKEEEEEYKNKIKIPPISPKGNGDIPYDDILKDLNDKTGKHYRATNTNKVLIKARWKEGFDLISFQTVHTKMAAKWLKDEKMNQYLRPSTLYQAAKFEGYLNQIEVQLKPWEID